MCIHMQQQLVIKGRSALRNIVHCCTIFLKSSGYWNRHRNPNINKNVRGHNMKKKKTTKNKVRGNVGRSLQMGFWQLDSVATTYIQCNGYFDVAPMPILPHIGPDCTFQSSRHTQDIQCKVWVEWLDLKNVIYFICDQIQQVESES